MITKIFCILLLSLAFMTSGCARFYQDINKFLLITSVLVDVGNNGDPKVYIEAFRPLRSSSKEKKEDRVVYVISGKTISEIMDTLSTMTGNKPNFSHNRVIIFSKRAAEAGLAHYVDFFARNPETLIRSYVAIYDGKPEELFDAKLPGDKFLGLHIFDLFRNYNLKTSKLMEVTIKDFYNGQYESSHTSVLPLLVVDKNIDNIPAENGAAVLRNFKLAAVLPEAEMPYYGIFQGINELSIFTIDNPFYAGSLISLRNDKTKVKTRIYYDGTNILLNKTVTLYMTIQESQDRITLTPEQREQITAALTQHIMDDCNIFFNKYKGQPFDIFDATELFRRKYPNLPIEDPLEKMTLTMSIHVNIEGSGEYKSF